MTTASLWVVTMVAVRSRCDTDQQIYIAKCMVGCYDASRRDPWSRCGLVARWPVDLVVTLGVLFCVSLIDLVNLGSANIAGMGQDLQLVGDRYVSLPLLITSSYVKTTTLSGADCWYGGF
ncbi:uncharacterized protein B0I36DRAFT_326274 [Microdochium trichocladiopsis]|uniref:Uncharacterized protein n=1 Tax=Microdochium trichocladiopsis TaxID=1682393 RepID=A0A9P8Y4V7_9PEZI|nr:uncharacterized protein B0I36DRAFT_326274 [Microdochium trichocladiopsis]KAH7029731.1 hypothetical protein B0I36DRAFT_326274 [Microdochium trichocladiopsis]